MNPCERLTGHVDELAEVLPELRGACVRLHRWGMRLAELLPAGHRLMAAGNGGSAAEAQHLTAELVGRFRDERQPLSAIALHAETSSVTAIANDYGYQETFARQVRAHGRPRDVLLLLSTSGASANLIAAAEAAAQIGVETWSLTGAEPNPLAAACDDAICLPGSPATVQEAQLVAVHLLCIALDAALAEPARSPRRTYPARGRPRPVAS
jgi:D-sedoheptulose 7-phosphate isomerase